jgi:plasmid stabilization system protein ParE
MFRARWMQRARDDLAAVWLAADSAGRRAITAASSAIDRQLQAGPDNCGESRPNGRRIHFVAPLAVLFEVDHQRSVVYVLHIWRY